MQYFQRMQFRVSCDLFNAVMIESHKPYPESGRRIAGAGRSSGCTAWAAAAPPGPHSAAIRIIIVIVIVIISIAAAATSVERPN